MKNSILVIGLAFTIAISSGCGPKGSTKAEKIETAGQMLQDTLQEAYTRKPDLKPMIEQAHGYAVFKNFGTQLMLLASGSG